MMRDRTKDIKFDKDYTLDEWGKDSKALDSLLDLLQGQDQKDLEDFWVAKINKRMEIQADFDIRPYLSAKNVMGAGARKLGKIFWNVIDNSTDQAADAIKERFRKKDFKLKNPLSLGLGMGKEEKKVLKILARKYKWLPTKKICTKTRLDIKKVVPILEKFVKTNLIEHRKIYGSDQWKTIIKS